MTIACPDCGTLQQLPRLRRGDVATCGRCEARLERVWARSINVALACSLATFILLFPANLTSLLEVRFAGLVLDIRLGSGVLALIGKGWILLALMIAVTAVLLPFIRYALLTAALGAVQLGLGKTWRGPVFRWAILLDRWSMPEVFLIAAIIGYARIEAQASIVYVGPGGYCLLAASALAMLSRALLDRRTVWRALGPETTLAPGAAVLSCTVCDLVQPLEREGQPCPRCGLTLRRRIPGVRKRTLALIIASLLLYIPANVFPMNVTHYPDHYERYRIIDGVMALFGAGLWPLGIMISCTSIGIPVAKLVGLGWCLLSIHRRSNRHLVLKTKLYRLIDESGRWSNVDPFIIAVIVPLMHFRNFIVTDAGVAASAFIAVVVLTMTASRSFDPRLMWDAALEHTGGR
ncbi:MAG TPA: paraquat-inducible protein A [Steroidobacteraceae bacterium]|nr:paraquat-inducible protein A [Steroidobacteraceae bacterium]